MSDTEKFSGSRFDPCDPEYRWHLWARVPDGEEVRTHVYWRRIALCGAAGAILFWLAMATAWWSFLRFQRELTSVQWVDVAFYPWRKGTYRKAQAEDYLRRGLRAIDERSWVDTRLLLHSALAKEPALEKARETLAAFYAAGGSMERAILLLEEGIDARTRPDSVLCTALVGCYSRSSSPQRISSLVRYRLQLPAGDDIATLRFVMNAANALIACERAKEATEIIERWNLTRWPDGQLLNARIERLNGNSASAIAMLRKLVEAHPEFEPPYVDLVGTLLDAGAPTAAREAALSRVVNFPRSDGALLDLIAIEGKRDPLTLPAAVEDYLRRFGDRTPALLGLARFAADSGEVALARRLVDLTTTGTGPDPRAQLALALSQCAAGDFRGALATAASVSNSSPEIANNLRLLRCWAHFGAGEDDVARGELEFALREPSVFARDLSTLAAALERLGKIETATQIYSALAGRPGATPSLVIAKARFHLRHAQSEAAVAMLPMLRDIPHCPRQLLDEITARAETR